MQKNVADFYMFKIGDKLKPSFFEISMYGSFAKKSKRQVFSISQNFFLHTKCDRIFLMSQHDRKEKNTFFLFSK
jgi:hypothetical protein